ncbi:STK38 [Cordylochernes scorpioides]|uniref:STK38 n=1 Tax=Cordylochernes scorpioides TaxID=51811 RepID=A0ABY6KN41_9ARAC|nr:STK38 [Cordylochernes scorpioides]
MTRIALCGIENFEFEELATREDKIPELGWERRWTPALMCEDKHGIPAWREDNEQAGYICSKMGKLNSWNQLKAARPERMRPLNALRKSFNRFRRKHRVKIPKTSQIIHEGFTANNSTEFDSAILEAYEPVKLLGKGGFGQIFLVKDKISKEPFALKIIKNIQIMKRIIKLKKIILELSIDFHSSSA